MSTAPPAHPGPPSPPPPPAGRRVLVVEADAGTRALLVGALADAGYAVRAAEHGAAARRRWRR